MGIHENIRRLREEQNLTLEEVGKRTGTTKQTIKRYESGEISTIPYDRILSLAKCFGVTPGSLMGWEVLDEKVEADIKLQEMDNRMKEYAIRLSTLSKEKREKIFSLIDILS